MTGIRRASGFLFVALIAACSSPSSAQRAATAELGDLDALKRQYSGVIAGFEVRPDDTLIVSLDLQRYIEMDDDAAAAMKRDALEDWRAAWVSQHPHERSTLRVHLIDFIGRKVADETTSV
jgi:hypothetical protein